LTDGLVCVPGATALGQTETAQTPAQATRSGPVEAARVSCREFAWEGEGVEGGRRWRTIRDSLTAQGAFDSLL